MICFSGGLDSFNIKKGIRGKEICLIIYFQTTRRPLFFLLIFSNEYSEERIEVSDTGLWTGFNYRYSPKNLSGIKWNENIVHKLRKKRCINVVIVIMNLWILMKSWHLIIRKCFLVVLIAELHSILLTVFMSWKMTNG